MSVHGGIWNHDREPVDRLHLQRISRALAEYGPDGEAFYVDGSLGILYRAFHTTLESRLEAQPHVSPRGKVVTWDGRLDNREELVVQLQGCLTDDRSDVAIVAAAIDRWGTSCFSKLVGDWGIAIWDSANNELIIARDYIGIKHFYYYHNSKCTLWCNHLAPLALCGDTFTLCDRYIAGYLAADPESDLTPYEEIRSVNPGTLVRIHATGVVTETYWTFNCQQHTYYKTDAEYEEHYRHLFRQAVRRRLRATSPALADLSGGFDSSSIVCMADDIIAKNDTEVSRVDTFSVYDLRDSIEGDLPYLSIVEANRKRKGFHYSLHDSAAALAFDRPSFVAIPTFWTRPDMHGALSSVLQQGKYRVLLSGGGGDEVNGQPLDPRIVLAELFLGFHLITVARELTTWSLLFRRLPWTHLCIQSLLQLAPVSIRAKLIEQGKLEAWVTPTFARKYGMSAYQVGAMKGILFLRPSARDAVQTITILSRIMTRTEPSRVEKRYPFLDQNLLEFLMTIPLDQLLRPGQRRSLMRRALSGLLPTQLLNRQIKPSFDRCFSVTLERNWHRVVPLFESPLSARLGYIDAKRLLDALAAFKGGDCPRYVTRLLSAFALEVWLRDVASRQIFTNMPLETRGHCSEAPDVCQETRLQPT